MDFHQYVKDHMATAILLSTLLQVAGTLLLALFSFYGVKVTHSANVFINNRPATHVELVVVWLNAAKAGLIFLLLGIVVSGIAGVCGAA